MKKFNPEDYTPENLAKRLRSDDDIYWSITWRGFVLGFVVGAFSVGAVVFLWHLFYG